MKRRTVLAGAAWVAPTILIAKPSSAATLSFPPGVEPHEAAPAVKAKQSLAFTGDNSEQDALIAVGLIGAGWIATRWAGRKEPSTMTFWHFLYYLSQLPQTCTAVTQSTHGIPATQYPVVYGGNCLQAFLIALGSHGYIAWIL